MPTLEDSELVFRFPEIEPEAKSSIDFQRTLRIPDTDETYPLPAGLGSFPLQRVDDYRDTLPSATVERGGVFLGVAPSKWSTDWGNFIPQIGGSLMAGKRNISQETVLKLRQVEILQGQEMTKAEAVRQIGVTQRTFIEDASCIAVWDTRS